MTTTLGRCKLILSGPRMSRKYFSPSMYRSTVKFYYSHTSYCSKVFSHAKLGERKRKLKGLSCDAVPNSPPAQGPYCIFVGPLEEADQSDLEELYLQAKDEYYSGHPVVLDEMFDTVEKRLKWFKSSLVHKYPRCSLKKFSAYSDAEWDEPQILALSWVWASLCFFGLAVALAPPFFLPREMESQIMGTGENPLAAMLSQLSSTLSVDGSLLIIGCAFVGLSITAAAGRSLKNVWDGNLAALRGICPACGEEVYAFIKVESSSQLQHNCECHVCDQPLAFRAKLEQPGGGKVWGYGRIYSLIRVKDLAPKQGTQSTVDA